MYLFVIVMAFVALGIGYFVFLRIRAGGTQSTQQGHGGTHHSPTMGKSVRTILWAGLWVGVFALVIPTVLEKGVDLIGDYEERESRQRAELAERLSVVRQQEAARLQLACGANGEPDCICRGDDVATRIMRPNEVILVNTKSTKLGFDPMPSPTTFAVCRTSMQKCITDNVTTLSAGTAVKVVNLSGVELPLYCRYHD